VITFAIDQAVTIPSLISGLLLSTYKKTSRLSFSPTFILFKSAAKVVVTKKISHGIK